MDYRPKCKTGHYKTLRGGKKTSLVVQWLRFCAPSERAPGLILVRELDSTCCN